MTMGEAVLRCPRCGAGMATFRQDGITLEQCAICHGVFMAHPELEHLMQPPYTGRHRRPG